MKARITGFAECKDNKEHKVVFVKKLVEDDFTGLSKEVKATYICLTSFYFIDLINKECELTIIHSDKLNKDICVDIKEVK